MPPSATSAASEARRRPSGFCRPSHPISDARVRAQTAHDDDRRDRHDRRGLDPTRRRGDLAHVVGADDLEGHLGNDGAAALADRARDGDDLDRLRGQRSDELRAGARWDAGRRDHLVREGPRHPLAGGHRSRQPRPRLPVTARPSDVLPVRREQPWRPRRAVGGLSLGLSLAFCAGCARAPARGTPAPLPAATAGRMPFVSFNVPTLHYIEDDSRFESMQHQRLPDDFEIRDALQTIRLMGGTVVRIYTLSVKKPTDPPDVVRHVLGPNQFNEAAFVALDRVLATAAEFGIQIIMPFVDNWPHWGGIGEYAAFRGKRRQDFFTDEQLITDFEATLDKVLLRTNTINGRAYRDDPTIYAWETGNELARPDAWAARIAKYIKQRDPHHALIDGNNGPSVREASIVDPDIDIVSSHHYGLVRRNRELIDDNVRKIAGRKRYLIGEVGLWSAADTESLLRHVVTLPIEGVLLWGLRGHSREGGFYDHLERAPFESYHLTGSDSGAAYDEQAIMKMMRALAFASRGLPVPPLPAPPPPLMLGATPRGAGSGGTGR